MRTASLLTQLLQLKQTRVRKVLFDEEGLVAEVGLTTRIPRCCSCGDKARRGYDERPRLWRHLDLAGMMLKLRYAIRRVACRRCGVTTEAVPWADHAVGFTRAFEDHAGYLTQRADRTMVSTLLPGRLEDRRRRSCGVWPTASDPRIGSPG